MQTIKTLLWFPRLWFAVALDRISHKRFNLYLARTVRDWYLAQGFSVRTLRFKMQQMVDAPKNPA